MATNESDFGERHAGGTSQGSGGRTQGRGGNQWAQAWLWIIGILIILAIIWALFAAG